MNSDELLAAARAAAAEEARKKRLIEQLPELERKAQIEATKAAASEQADIMRQKINAALVSWKKAKQERDEQIKGLLLIFRDTLSFCRQYDLNANDLLKTYHDLAYWQVESEQGPLTDSYSHFERGIAVQGRQAELFQADGVNAFSFNPLYKSGEIDALLALLMDYVRLDIPVAGRLVSDSRFNIKSHQQGKGEQQAAMSDKAESAASEPKNRVFRGGKVF